MSDKSGSAFPESYVGEDSPHSGIGNGLTKREWYAGLAMQGLLANDGDVRADAIPGVASRAFMWADAMIEEAAK